MKISYIIALVVVSRCSALGVPKASKPEEEVGDHSDCWKQEHWNGMCGENPEWMKEHCPKQCQGECQDRISNCEELQREGWCKNAVKPWMQINCCVQCKKAPQPPTPADCEKMEKEQGMCGENPALMKKYCPKQCQGCKDRITNCASLKAAGSCESSKAWMDINCCVSCKKAPEPPTPTNCEKLEKEQGMCGENPEWMKKNCPKQCQGCKDRITNCASLKAAGSCESSKAWMDINCCVSCKKEPTPTNCEKLEKEQGMCGENPEWMKKNCPQQCQGCKDRITNCASLKAAGSCESSKAWMDINCCVSCSKGPLCQDKRPECPDWSEEGWCMKYPVMMKAQCCETCTQ